HQRPTPHPSTTPYRSPQQNRKTIEGDQRKDHRDQPIKQKQIQPKRELDRFDGVAWLQELPLADHSRTVEEIRRAVEHAEDRKPRSEEHTSELQSHLNL